MNCFRELPYSIICADKHWFPTSIANQNIRGTDLSEDVKKATLHYLGALEKALLKQKSAEPSKIPVPMKNPVPTKRVLPQRSKNKSANSNNNKISKN